MNHIPFRQNIFLFLLCSVVFFKQLLWIGFIPLWHFPDEQAHFAQVQNQVEGNPHLSGQKTTSKEIAESEGYLGTLRDWAGNNFFTYHPEFNIPYTNSTTGKYESTIRNFPVSWRTTLVIIEATAYPPLYYELSGIFYRLFYDASLFERVFAVRVFNLFFYLIILWTTYKTACLLFPKSQLLQATLVIFVGFHPMLSFLSAGVNSYNIFIASFSLALYVSLLVIYHGAKPYYLFWMMVLLILNIQGKTQGKLIPIIYLFPLIVAFWKSSYSRLLTLTTFIGGGFVAFGVTTASMVAGQQFLPDIVTKREYLVLPDLSLFAYLKNTLRLTIAQTVPWYWGVFRWLSLTFPRIFHRIINRFMIIALIGLFVKIYQILKRRNFSDSILGFLFLLYASGIYFSGIIFYDFLFTRSHGFSLGIQGRYFLPTVIFHMALLLMGVTTLFSSKTINHIVIKLSGFGMVLLHIHAFLYVAVSYYDTSSFKSFFIQASQYKPFIFKSPFLEGYIFITAIVLLMFLWYYLRMPEKKV